MSGRNLHTEVIYGPPGTGKTTTLLDLVESYLKRGVKPDEIAYLAFTVKAAREAIDRASSRFNLDASAFPWFRTIHSLAFRHLQLSSAQVLKRHHYATICNRLGYEFQGATFVSTDPDEWTPPSAIPGDRMLFLEGLAKARMVSYADQFANSTEDVSYYEFELLTNAVKQFKEAHFLLDFNDMLERMLKVDNVPGFKVLIVDEAQDLSNLQWAVISRVIENSELVHLAGDDDQAIFSWAGANPARFVSYGSGPGRHVRVLEQSYRVPRRVHDLATRTVGQLHNRPPKLYRPRDIDGVVEDVGRLEDLELDRGDWLILARNNYLLIEAQKLCLRDGLGYIGRGGKLHVPEGYDPESRPNVRISTIHGAKGAEATNVALYTDMSYKTWLGMQDNPDDEIRVFYVGITRAKENLYVIRPRSNNYVDFLDH